MTILVTVSHVFFLWFVISFTLGLCWAIACFVAPRVIRWRAGFVPAEAVRPTWRVMQFGRRLDESGALWVDDLDEPVTSPPRRFASHPHPVRENEHVS